jgi:hypothetical protein
MSDLKRDEIKYIRDKAKGRYQKGSECRICGSTEDLDFHHHYTLTPLYNKWKKDNNIVINCEEDVLAIRDRFISEHHEELYEVATTLCHKHHLQLHAIYGKDPALTTAKKQLRWVEIQRGKHGLN